MVFSEAYVALQVRGPFPNAMDPWLEAERYFHQLRGAMIGEIVISLAHTLLQKGYFLSRETSLQIAERRQPDVGVQRVVAGAAQVTQIWDYAAVAEAVALEPGVAVPGAMAELDAVYIYEQQGDQKHLVTIIELVSPRNKTVPNEIESYQLRRQQLLSRAVNIVEVDLTRSNKRLFADAYVETFAYHIAIFVPGNVPYVLGFDVGQAVPTIALPLAQEVVPLALQDVYRRAYTQSGIAAQLFAETGYAPNALPFPTLLTDAQREHLNTTVAAWQTELDQLRHAP